MGERQLFPASIVDDITYCTDRAHPHLSLNYAWIFTLEGEVSSEIARKALDGALNHYPKARCILVNNYPSYKRWFRYRWEYTGTAAQDILEEVQFPGSHAGSEDAVNYYINNHARFSIDLSSQIPLKVVLLRAQQRAFLFFIMHHAVGDGLGGFFFIQKFIQCYEDIYYGRPQGTPGKINARVISSPEIRFRWSHLSPRYLGPYVRHLALMIKEPPLNLFPQQTARISGEFLATVRHLDSPQLEAIRSTAKKQGATINDYLLATMFRTIKKWSQGWITPSDRINITVPINLRSPEDRSLSNTLSGVTVSLKTTVISNTEQMLSLVRQELTALVNSTMHRTLIHLSSLLKPLPIPLRTGILHYSSRGTASSIVISNMGVLSPNPAHQDEAGFNHLGPARISNLHGMPPVGAWPMLFICTYNKSMIFNLSFLDSYFPQEAGERFIDAYLAELTG